MSPSCSPSITGREHLRAKLHPALSNDFEGLQHFSRGMPPPRLGPATGLKNPSANIRRLTAIPKSGHSSRWEDILPKETLRTVTQSPYKFTHVSPIQTATSLISRTLTTRNLLLVNPNLLETYSSGRKPVPAKPLCSCAQLREENAGVSIISPTRELATQIAKETLNLAYHQKDLQVQQTLVIARLDDQTLRYRGCHSGSPS